jgi:hypothetical protein
VSSVVIVAPVGGAAGSRPAAAALACAGSSVDRACLLVDLDPGRLPRHSLFASAAARELEERLAAHIPEAAVASRGRICHLALPEGEAGFERVGAAIVIGRGSPVIVHLTPSLVQPSLDWSPRPTGAALRADLGEDRALTALAVGDLLERGLRVAVLKRSVGLISAHAALAGLSATIGDGGLPSWVGRRLLSPETLPSVVHRGVTVEDSR